MLAYNNDTLNNLDIKEEAEKALRKDCIDAATYQAIITAHPVNLYTPNPIIRAGLFILTLIVVSLSLGFMTLVSLTALKDEKSFGGLCIFAALLCYGALELFLREKKLFRAGVDDALLWCTVSLLLSSLAIYGTDSMLTWSLSVLALTLMATLRFADMVMAAAAFLSLLALVFVLTLKTGVVSRTLIPFLIMALSLLVYFASRKGIRQPACKHYRACLTVVSVLSLLTLYLAGNYFVVRELSNELFDLQLQPGQSIPGASFFWVYTVVVPLVYLYLGIRKKDTILLRTGMILLAAIVFTIRAYHSVMPLETAMAVGGLVLTIGAWALIRYLKVPRQGFTYEEDADPSLADKLKIESLIIAQTYAPVAHTPGNNMDFGGGSGGGGGASGDY